MLPTNSSPLSEGIISFVEAPAALRKLGAVNLPDVSTMRGHAYNGRFDYVRLPNGKLAVRQADLPAIARQYGAPVGVDEVAA